MAKDQSHHHSTRQWIEKHKKRAEQSKGTLILQSDSYRGTQITVDFPIASHEISWYETQMKKVALYIHEQYSSSHIWRQQQSPESLKFLLDSTDGFECTGSFPDCTMLLDDSNIGEPEVILMDIDMPGMTGIEAVAEVKKHTPRSTYYHANCVWWWGKNFRCHLLRSIRIFVKRRQLSINSEFNKRSGRWRLANEPGIARKVMKLLSQNGNNQNPTEIIHLTDREKMFWKN